MYARNNIEISSPADRISYPQKDDSVVVEDTLQLVLPDAVTCKLPVHNLSTENVRFEMYCHGTGGVGKVLCSRVNRRKRQKSFTYGTTIFRREFGEKRLHQAVSSGNAGLVEELLLEGVNPCCSDDKLRSPLHLAAAAGNEKIIKLLLDFGADPNQKDLIGNTALHLAACTCKVPVVTLLLQRGTDVRLLDHSGRTPLHCAASRLKFLQENKQFTSLQLKEEVTQIVTMMREYLDRSGQGQVTLELNDLCNQLELTATNDEIDLVGGLLSKFADLQIQKIHQNS